MSNNEKNIDAYFNNIRDQFNLAKLPQSNPLSWGQFIEPHPGEQNGLYGTVAAAIALKAKNATSPEAQAAETELVNYWYDRKNTLQYDNLCQNIRLAALLLGLCFCSQRNQAAISEIASELKDRFVEHEGLWMDSCNPPVQGTPLAEFSSAIIIIFSFAAIQQYMGNAGDFGNLNDKLESAAKALQKLYLDDRKRDRPYLPALLIAVILALGKYADAAVCRRLSQFSYKSENIFQRFWYHLDFIDQNGERKRDYFIIPTRLLVPFLFLQTQIWKRHYLYANEELTAIKRILDSNETGLFREVAGRPSSLEQALVVLALKASQINPQNKYALFLPRLWIAINKQRKHEWIFAWVLIIFGYFPVGVIVSAEWLLGTGWSDLWNGERQLLEAANHLPSWIPTTIFLIFTAFRNQLELVKAAIGKDSR